MTASCRRCLPLIFVFAAWSVSTGLGPVLRAENGVPPAPVKQPVKQEALRHTQANGWHIAESRNFRFHHHSQSNLVARLAVLCEDSRTAIRQRWLSAYGTANWSIKCDVFLYPTPTEYQQKTRFPADSWGFADLEIGEGKVWMRRLDLRSDNEARVFNVAVHELTHVILADRFAHKQIPRWADEGIALNSEPPARQKDMRGWLAAEIKQGRGFTLHQLLSMQQYPQNKHLGDLFYAQSGSLVEFLLSQNSDSEEGVLRFVEGAQQGLDKPLSGVTLTKLESEWKAWLMKSHAAGGVQLAADRP
ncbi:MAG: hypothetical protein JWN70_2758 [Planctomycetaceae bacterium]|nr:hypothetical protein [Planctomycetaceae bacterium]